MKRNTIQHPKTLALAVALGVPRYAAVGILESLWHFAASYALPGNVGRFDDAVIAQAVGWERNPTELIDALVNTRWLDRHAAHRLVIHDWHDHADDGLRKVLRNQALTFWNGSPPYQERDKDSGSRTVRESFDPVCAPQPKPQPLPQPLPQPQPKPQPSSGGDAGAVQPGGGVGGLAGTLARIVKGAAAAGDSGNEIDRQHEVQALLASVNVNPDVQRELYVRKDITPKLVEHHIEAIRKAGNADELAAVLVARLRNHGRKK